MRAVRGLLWMSLTLAWLPRGVCADVTGPVLLTVESGGCDWLAPAALRSALRLETGRPILLVEAGASGPSRLQLACGENRLQLRWRAAPGGATRMRALDMSGSAAEGRIRMLALLIMRGWRPRPLLRATRSWRQGMGRSLPALRSRPPPAGFRRRWAFGHHRGTASVWGSGHGTGSSRRAGSPAPPFGSGRASPPGSSLPSGVSSRPGRATSKGVAWSAAGSG